MIISVDQGGTKEVLPKVKKVMNVQDVVVGSMNMEEQGESTKLLKLLEAAMVE